MANPRVSVCMAVHNGAPFLLRQLESILAQLGPGDEVVVVDDASRDQSVELLYTVTDSRLRIVRNERNLGVLATFERALQLASGDILFLSDQDDVWLPGKVRSTMDVFSTHPAVTLTVSDARLIDAGGTVIADSFFRKRGRFAAGAVRNLMRNNYLGCTLAFRRSMLSTFLPIPPDVPMHDVWFGILNDLYGQTRYIDEPLVEYRRHDSNVSRATSAPLTRGLVWRVRLIRRLLGRMLRLALGRG